MNGGTVFAFSETCAGCEDRWPYVFAGRLTRAASSR